MVRRHWIPHYLHNVIALALVCGSFAISNLLEAESGLLTVTVMGLWLANVKDLDLEELLDFKESLSLLLISALFIILAARMDLESFFALGWPALGVFAAIQFLARPLSIQLSAFGSKLSMAERHLLSWIAPRGIVAAAITAFFAIKLEDLGYSNAPQLVPLTFMVIIGTVLLQSATAGPIARALKVAEPEPKGFLIIGANQVARKLAKALQEKGFRTLLTDQNWSAVSDAKLLGLQAYWGSPVSEHAERHLNLIGIGHLLAMTSNQELNALATYYYRYEFEPNRIFSVRQEKPEKPTNGEKKDYKYVGGFLFDESLTFQKLQSLVAQGAEIKATQLTDEFSFADYQQKHQENRIPLFAIDEKGRVHIFSAARSFSPEENWTLLALTKID
jgi:CPA1 family monovalent cation:H+ antiporter